MIHSTGVSILILTLNEELNIADCIASVSWSDDIVVLDSLSSDRTAEIAEGMGARVVKRPFDDWSSHQNWALSNIDFRNRWVLYLDADERCTAELRDEIAATLISDPANAAFRLRRKDFFLGTWLKHAQLYPTWFVRLFRPASVRFERLVNPVPVVDGDCGELEAHIVHYPFSHGVAHWVGRHNRYSDLEAIERDKLKGPERLEILQAFSADPFVRRRALKNVFLRIPFRAPIKFTYYYLIRRGFLDGRAGLIYSTLQAFYEYLIEVKHLEIRRRSRGQSV